MIDDNFLINVYLTSNNINPKRHSIIFVIIIANTANVFAELQNLNDEHNNRTKVYSTMKHEEGNFEGMGGTSLFYQSWLPDEDPIGVVIVIHGLAEHSGRYMNVVNTLVPEGYAVWAFDHRGHGKSDGKRCHVNRFTDYLEDVLIFEMMARKSYPDLPFHLIGHSMGSMIANHYMASKADQNIYRSLTLSGTGAAPGPAIGAVTKFMSKIFSVLLPKISIPSGLNPEFISHDKEVVDTYINDPLVETKLTPRLGNELMKYVSKMTEVSPNLITPTLMQIGSEDTAFHPNSWQALFESIGSEKKDFKRYENYRHEVYNEVKKEVPLGDLKDWINTHNS